MTIYLVIFGCMFFAYILQDITSKSIVISGQLKYEQGPLSKMIFLFECMCLILLVGLRGTTGTDTPNYKVYYQTGFYPIDTEKYYVIFSDFLMKNQISFEAFELIWATITFAPIFFVLYKLSKNYVFSMLALYLLCLPFYAMNISRQLFSVGLFSLVIYLIIDIFSKRNNNKLFEFFVIIITSIIAINIHESFKIAIVILIAIVLLFFTFNKWPHLVVISGVVSIILALFSSFDNTFSAAISSLLTTQNPVDRYSDYLVSNKLYKFSMISFILSILKALFIFSPYIRNYSIQSITNRFLIASVVVFTMVTSLQPSWITDRIGLYLTIFFAILCSNVMFEPVIKRPKSLIVQFYLPTIVFLILLISFVRFLTQNWSGIIPYRI